MYYQNLSRFNSLYKVTSHLSLVRITLHANIVLWLPINQIVICENE